MAGRIGSYIHSDSITRNKGGLLVCVTCDTDFAAKTNEFIAFVDKVAKFGYAGFRWSYSADAQKASDAGSAWDQIISLFPDLEEERVNLEKTLTEKIQIREICKIVL